MATTKASHTSTKNHYSERHTQVLKNAQGQEALGTGSGYASNQVPHEAKAHIRCGFFNLLLLLEIKFMIVVCHRKP